MGADAPQWLFSSFTEAMHDIGATASIPVLEAEARDLVSRWNERGRALTTRVTSLRFSRASTGLLQPRTTPMSCASPCGTRGLSLTGAWICECATPTPLTKLTEPLITLPLE